MKTTMNDAAPQGVDMLIPLSELHVSEANARKTQTGDVGELAALIRAEGLLQRLAVVKESGGYGVVAGGRRLRAMQSLVADGSWTVAQLVECRLFDLEHGARLSLVENSGREAMHPADQMEAFKRLIDAEGLTPEQVAGRFGVSVLTVQRRLKLAALAPRFLALYRADEITTEQLMALTLCESHDAQCATWDALPNYSRSAYNIRNLVEQDGCDADDRLAVYVGLQPYQAAGGRMRQDLFSDKDSAGFLQDGALLAQLALKKLEVAGNATKENEGWAWSVCTLDSNARYGAEMRAYGREDQSSRKPTKAETKAFAVLDAVAKEAAAAANAHFDNADEEAEDYEETAERLQDAAEQAEATANEARNVLQVWAPEQLQRAGVMVFLTHRGGLEIVRGLVRTQDKKAVVDAMRQAGEPVPSDTTKGQKAEFSERLMRDMSAHRTAAMQASMVKNPRVALVALVHRLAMSVFGTWQDRGDNALAINLTAKTPDALANVATEYLESPAALAMTEATAAWEARLPENKAGLFDWLEDQEASVLLELLAYCTAQSVDCVQPRPGRLANADRIVQALDLDMADWWGPTPGKYLGGVSKAKAIEAVQQACGMDASETKRVGAMKRAEATAYCEKKLEGTRWLPEPLTAPSARGSADQD